MQPLTTFTRKRPVARQSLAEEIETLIRNRRYGASFASDLSDLIEEWGAKASTEEMRRALKGHLAEWDAEAEAEAEEAEDRRRANPLEPHHRRIG